MAQRAKLIFNPHANSRPRLVHRPVLQAIVSRHPDAEWAATEFPSHAVQLAEQAAEQGFGVVAAIGGDEPSMRWRTGSCASGRAQAGDGDCPVGSGMTLPPAWAFRSIWRSPWNASSKARSVGSTSGG